MSRQQGPTLRKQVSTRPRTGSVQRVLTQRAMQCYGSGVVRRETSWKEEREAMPLAFTRSLCVLTIVVVGLASTAYAQEEEPVSPQVKAKQLRASCKADYAKFCPGGPPSIFFEQACLKQSYLNLSTVCQHALDNMSQDNTGEPNEH